MHCREFQQRLNAVLDERENPAVDPPLAAHAAQCEPCQSLLDVQDALTLGLAEMRAPPLSRDFARRVVAQAALKPSHPLGRRAWLAAAASLASAAAMLGAIGLVWHARREGEPMAPRIAAASRSILKPQPRSGGGFAIALPGGSQRSQAAHRPPLTGAELVLDAPRLPSHLRSYRGAIDQLAETLPEAAHRLEEVERLTPGMRRLRVSLSMIWNTLCGAFPGAAIDAPPPTPGRTSLWWSESIRVA